MKITEILNTAIPKFSLFGEILKKPLIGLYLVGTTVPTAIIVNIWSAFYALCWFFVADLITGLFASYNDWKRSDKKDRWFFGKGEGFSSDKFKKMFIKIIVYCGTPLVIYNFQKTFLLKNISYKRISDAEIDLATFFILIFILNEGFSIFHENLPKCGFNIWHRIKKMIGFYKEIKNEIKE
ncbi:phage holin family protein [Flavobacterium sediminilitoris]|uniref:Phage holin family protein n=1 Tax=Flavobacterium sediminilitoris TaxID=2024526 RepID=A0ABY4HRX3_9FLAO|nr:MULTISPECIES: phage holin family protein [Flavobacterium]UOX35318.1 phage holin family protein [Flavobacterium sediminilitoris]